MENTQPTAPVAEATSTQDQPARTWHVTEDQMLLRTQWGAVAPTGHPDWLIRSV